jgi:AraC family transcriptional regulator of adaptative response / DNA-3-methyladenine glycosylase II
VELDPAHCYQALCARDARFDGRFFTGVRTTGVYCRPVCPARTPKRENVAFFACAAAAEAAGFRPCRRCRPERSPGTPAWPEVPDPVARALRLIGDGILEEGGIDDVATRVGVGARQLRRLFLTHLGVPPLAVARARRVHFARRLLDETDFPVTEVAFAAGFRSIRQFNHDVLATFGRPPTALRARGATPGRPAASEERALTMRLTYRPPLDWETMLGFIAGRCTRGVEVVEGRTYRRLVEIHGRPGVIELCDEPGKAHLVLRARLADHDGLIAVVSRARRIADLDADPLVIGSRLGADPLLRPLVRARPGLRVPGTWDPFETTIRAILGQQVSVRSASAAAARLVEAFGKPVEGFEEQGLTHSFPAPAMLADADVASIGITQAQARAIRALATAVTDGEISLGSTGSLDDLIERLRALPGIGEWTAQYVAMRACGEPDAFPAGDLGLRKAAGGVSERALRARAEEWRPWRAYAAMHLWTGGSS